LAAKALGYRLRAAQLFELHSDRSLNSAKLLEQLVTHGKFRTQLVHLIREVIREQQRRRVQPLGTCRPFPILQLMNIILHLMRHSKLVVQLASDVFWIRSMICCSVMVTPVLPTCYYVIASSQSDDSDSPALPL